MMMIQRDHCFKQPKIMNKLASLIHKRFIRSSLDLFSVPKRYSGRIISKILMKFIIFILIILKTLIRTLRWLKQQMGIQCLFLQMASNNSIVNLHFQIIQGEEECKHKTVLFKLFLRCCIWLMGLVSQLKEHKKV